MVIEAHLAVEELVFKMVIGAGWLELFGDPSQRQVVRGHQAQSAALDQSPRHTSGPNRALVRIGAPEISMEQEHQWRSLPRQLHDLPQTGDFGIEPRGSFVNGIHGPNRGADAHMRQTELPRAHWRPFA